MCVCVRVCVCVCVGGGGGGAVVDPSLLIFYFVNFICEGKLMDQGMM